MHMFISVAFHLPRGGRPHFVMKLTLISLWRAHETFPRVNSNLMPAAFYWYLHSAAFAAAGYTQHNPPTKSHHNGAARTCQQTVAQFLSRHCQWIISSHHFAKKKKRSLDSAEVGEQFRWLKIDCCVFGFNWQLLWLILFGLSVSLYNNFSSRRSRRGSLLQLTVAVYHT